MAYRALTAVLLGNGPAAQAGEIIPEHFPGLDGHPVPVDFERLVELEAAEKVPAPQKAAPAVKRHARERHS